MTVFSVSNCSISCSYKKLCEIAESGQKTWTDGSRWPPKNKIQMCGDGEDTDNLD